jgi:16S rRNA (uracil1498-N3)-methyltransferase
VVSARFFCPDLPDRGKYRLDADESRHLSQVCRLTVGDEVELFDGDGRAVAARIVELGRKVVELAASGEVRVEPPLAALTLAIGAPKGDRFAWLVEKATELGVARLVPIRTRRSVVEPRSTKLDRLRRTVIEASKQCGRNRLMVLEEPTPWPRFAEAERAALRLIAHPGGPGFQDWPAIVEGEAIVLAVGPEGGFADDEIESAVAFGWRPVGLGRKVLRIETAGIAGCSAILARTIARDVAHPVH